MTRRTESRKRLTWGGVSGTINWELGDASTPPNSQHAAKEAVMMLSTPDHTSPQTQAITKTKTPQWIRRELAKVDAGYCSICHTSPHVDVMTKDGHRYPQRCKACVAMKTRAHCRNHPEQRVAYMATERGKEVNRRALVKYNNINPDKYTARWKVREALKSGRLQKGICACGSEKANAHHWDYSKPLDVIWLCSACHVEEHNRLRRERSASPISTYLRDQLSNETGLLRAALKAIADGEGDAQVIAAQALGDTPPVCHFDRQLKISGGVE